MIKNSFIFLDNIGEKNEKSFWQQGIGDWSDFLSAANIKGLSLERKQKYDETLKEAKKKLWLEDVAYFNQLFPSAEHWRLYNHFKEDAVFLDIETEGHYGNITVVGLFDGKETKTFVRGINLDRNLLAKELQKYKMLITFNGRSFDMPVIQRYFNLNPDIPHIDLKTVCGRIGLTGGLKVIEQQLGIKRPESIKYVTGHDAANLWRCWKATGDNEFLQMLITYNEEDIVNLQRIADLTISELWKKTTSIIQ